MLLQQLFASSYASFLTNDPLLFNVHVHVLNDVQIVKVVHNIKRTDLRLSYSGHCP